MSLVVAGAVSNPLGADRGPPPEQPSASSWTNTVAQGAGGSPADRFGHSAIYNETLDRMVVFGGLAGVGYRNNVFVLENASWAPGTQTWTNTMLQDEPGSPQARDHHTSVYDASADRMIVFGGDTAGGRRNDVWVLGNASSTAGDTEWTNRVPHGAPGSPSARETHSAVYDPSTDRMVVFGGTDGASKNDLWILRNASGPGGNPEWSLMTVTGTPPAARVSHTAVYNSTSERMVVFAGSTAGGRVNDVWVLLNATGEGGEPEWIKTIADGESGSPPIRSAHSSVYDIGRDRMITFGGIDAGRRNDVWVLRNATDVNGNASWTNTVAQGAGGSPSARQRHTAVFDAGDNRMVMFGGQDDIGLRSDVWVLSEANGVPPIPEFVGPVALVGWAIAVTLAIAGAGRRARRHEPAHG
jgi:hypothetical protein